MPAVNACNLPGLDYIRKRTWSFKFSGLKPFSFKAVAFFFVYSNESSFFKGLFFFFKFFFLFCKISLAMLKWRSPAFLGGGSRGVTLFPPKIWEEVIKAESKIMIIMKQTDRIKLENLSAKSKMFEFAQNISIPAFPNLLHPLFWPGHF